MVTKRPPSRKVQSCMAMNAFPVIAANGGLRRSGHLPEDGSRPPSVQSVPGSIIDSLSSIQSSIASSTAVLSEVARRSSSRPRLTPTPTSGLQLDVLWAGCSSLSHVNHSLADVLLLRHLILAERGGDESALKRILTDIPRRFPGINPRARVISGGGDVVSLRISLFGEHTDAAVLDDLLERAEADLRSRLGLEMGARPQSAE